MKTICIYHKNCFDGICAAWVVWKKLGGAFDSNWNALPESNITFLPMNYGEPLDILQSYLPESGNDIRIIIVDFSFPKDTMIWLSGAKEIIVLDHHKTAEKECEGLDFCHFDMNESGASLAWKYFFPNEDVPALVSYIKDRDLWLYKESHSEIINSYIQSFPMTIENQEALYQQLEDTSYGFLECRAGGESILRYKNTMVEAMCKTVSFNIAYPFYDIRIPIVNASILFSEVGNELCKKFPNSPFAAYYFDRLSEGKRQWGLRSIGDFDVSEVAKKLGGGGHRNAAGFIQDLGGL